MPRRRRHRPDLHRPAMKGSGRRRREAATAAKNRPDTGISRCRPPIPAAINTRRSAGRRSSSRSPRTSQRRTIAATMARSRCVRSAVVSASTSAGDRIRGSRRVTRTSGTPSPGAVLRKLATEPAGGVQVVYATHSPFLLEAEGFPEIRRVTRRAVADTGFSEVSVRSSSRRAAEHRLVGITKPESVRKQLSGVCLTRLPDAFFANVVILVEGETDRAVLKGCALREARRTCGGCHGGAVVVGGRR
jgi:hypothetical protein